MRPKLGILALGMALSTPAFSADTYIYYNPTYMSASDISSLKTALTGVGATITTSTSSSWPTSWSGYQLVIILLPASTFNATQVAALDTMIDGGGRLVVSADWGGSSEWGGANGYVGSLLSGLGTGLTLRNSTVSGSGCSSTTSITADQVTDSVSTMYIAASNAFNGGTALVTHTSQTVLAVAQTSGAPSSRTPYDVVASGDVNIFLNSCSGATTSGRNYTLWENLYLGLCADADGDGHDDDTCGGDDCDDTNAAISPSDAEVAYDGIDNDCDGSDLTDVDGDGYDADIMAGGTDCDDSDSGTHPGAPELADGVDADCDGTVDEGTSWYDDDGDGWTETGGDCDDSDSSTHAGAVETCDGSDEDCDGTIDEGTSCFDDDGDGYTEDDGDCSDGDASVNPGETESVGNGVDDNCDGTVDDGSFDGDGDGYTSWADDCDDYDDTTYPGAPELPDGIDNDCDDTIDEGTSTYDDDGDGYSEAGGDCDDTNAEVSPGASETQGNGIDDDCNGTIDGSGDHTDDDGDGFSEDAGDCNDANPDMSPAETETLGNGLDDDCDGEVDEGTLDLDGDGVTEADGDCDDNDGWVFPEAAEMCDEVDNNCNGEIDEECELSANKDVPDSADACGCEEGGAALGLLPLAALLRRRKPTRQR